jgi:polysaccharide biosynthesis/export protein
MLPMMMKWSKLLLICALAVSAPAIADEPAADASAVTPANPPAMSPPSVSPAAVAETADPAGYQLQPGDVLTVTVWKETDLQGDVLIRPDGGLSFALAGELHAAGHTVAELTTMLAERIRRFVPDAVVTVAVKAASGNRVYVIGKVTKPGDFALSRPIDVMQALALAGGATPFAETNSIRILRRDASNRQTAIAFRYSDVARGRDLDQNILLQSGDTVVVP